MTPKQFSAALTAARMWPDTATAKACRLVLVEGISRNAASKRVGIDLKAVSRACEKLQPRQRCPECGHWLAADKPKP